jgi:hypothetical protein
MGLRYKIGKIDNRGQKYYIRPVYEEIDSSHMEYFNFIEIRIGDVLYEITEDKYYFFLVNTYSGDIIMPYEDMVNNGLYEIWWDETNSGIEIKPDDLLTITNFYNDVIKVQVSEKVTEKRKHALIKRRINIIDNITDDDKQDS